MKLSTGSKRADMVYVFFFWTTLMLACGKLSDGTYGLLVGALIGGYLTNRVLQKEKQNAETENKA